MIVFHGTDTTSANSIVKKIDVTKGGGELGRGFYVGENIALAASLAKGKFGSNSKVVKFDINDSEFIKLDIKTLNRTQYVYRTWQSLLRRNKAFSHLYNTDVICAPFATINFSYQYKFETPLAETVINTHSIKTIL